MIINTNPTMRSPILLNQSSPTRFQGNIVQTLGINALPIEVRPVGGFMRRMDFHDLATTTVNQVKVIYGMVILSRFFAAASRSWNELRETVCRDVTGYMLWLFITPILERLLLMRTKPEFKKALLIENPEPKGKILKWLWKPKLPTTLRWNVPTSGQIKDRMAQVQQSLLANGHKVDDAAYQKATHYFENLLKRRLFATGVGTGLTIAILGFGMPLLNMAITSKNVSQGKVGRG